MVNIIAYIAGVFLMLGFASHVIKTIRTKKGDDISALLLIFTLISAVLYEVYAILLDVTPVILVTGIFTFLAGWELILVFKYRTKRA